MASDWEVVKIEDIGDVKSGKRLPKGQTLTSDITPFPYIRLVDISDGKIRRNNLQYLTETTREKIKKYIVNESDVCLAIVGHTIGMVFYVEPEWDNNNLTENAARITNLNENISSKYLYYFLISPQGQSEIFSRKVGSAQGKLPLYNIKSLEVPLPPIQEQKAIAHILGSLDDKIELNRQMNETLEAMAQALFKSWFVDFDPVLDNALAAGNPIPDELLERAEQRQAMQNSDSDNQTIRALFPNVFEFTEEMGWIPSGWGISDIGTEFNIVGGGTPSTKNSIFWEDGNISWTTPKDLSGNQSKILLHTDRKITELGLKKISSGLLPVNTVLMSSRAPVGYLALAKVPVAINQGYIALKCEKILTPEFAIQWLDSIMDEIKQRAGGTTFAEISKTNFRGIPVFVPDKMVIESYSHNVRDLYHQITSRIENINTLAKLRDTLLPKLLSGELRISEAAAIVDEV
jgi:type I restriction enzyme S subunit